MIDKMSHVSVYVLNQEEAIKFYTEKLGFKISMDQTMPNGYRWVTLNPPEQNDLEIILMEPSTDQGLTQEQVKNLRTLIAEGALGAGVFHTSDCRKTYQEYKSRGVEFIKEPTEEFYAVEALFKDNSGNWYSLTQEKG
jgi:catechol 2,3-dioxygenase-like lactoylglutathione lyase family enzyme